MDRYETSRIDPFSALAGVVVTALSIGAYFLPFTEAAAESGAQHSRMALTVAMSALMCAAAVLFMRGVPVFRSGMRTAYTWLSGGLVLFGLSLLQWPASVYLGAAKNSWATSGAIIIPFILATAFMYVGMRKFAMLLSVETVLARWRVALPLVLATTISSGVVAHFWNGHPVQSLEADTYTATVAWTLAFGLLAWMIVLRIRRVIGIEYRYSMNWLAVSLGALVFSGAHEYIVSFVLDEVDAYVYTGASLWPFVLAGCLFMYAGRVFGGREPVSGASEGSEPDDESRVFIDGVVVTAQRASRPGDISGVLDDFRQVTARVASGEVLSGKDRAKLVDIYAKLEQYLTTTDPLRKFSREELRMALQPEFRAAVEKRQS